MPIEGRQRKAILALTLALGIPAALYQGGARVGLNDRSEVSQDGDAVRVPFATIVLVRSEGHCGALRLLRRSSHRGLFDGVKYEAWTSPDATCGFGPGTTHSTGYVFESYETVSEDDAGNRTVRNAAGRLNIEIGQLRASWSSESWVYTHPYFDGSESPEAAAGIPKRVEIAVTDWESLADVDVDPTELAWIGELGGAPPVYVMQELFAGELPVSTERVDFDPYWSSHELPKVQLEAFGVLSDLFIQFEDLIGPPHADEIHDRDLLRAHAALEGLDRGFLDVLGADPELSAKARDSLYVVRRSRGATEEHAGTLCGRYFFERHGTEWTLLKVVPSGEACPADDDS